MPGTAVSEVDVEKAEKLRGEGAPEAALALSPVSYTHLDVYKRQA